MVAIFPTENPFSIVDGEAEPASTPVPGIGLDRGVRELDEEECVQLLRVIRWPGGVACPHCLSTTVIRTGRHQGSCQRYRCKNCMRIFNDKTGTIFQDSRLPLKVWFLAALLQRGRTIRAVSNSLGTNYDTTQRMVAKLRQSEYPDRIANRLMKASAV